nr:uncharacterized protein LOC117224652 [Megalopta genalis]
MNQQVKDFAVKYHQFFYELLPDWFLYGYTDRTYIYERIGFALYGPPDYDEHKELNNDNADLCTFKGYNKDACKTITKIYKKILQSNGGNNFIQVGIIYIVVFDHEQPKNLTNSSDNCLNRTFVLPIFKLKLKDTILYIDNDARVYKNWEDYLENNTLPKCMMIIPKEGIYQCNPYLPVTKWSSTVWIQILPSPSCKAVKAVLKVVDISSSVVGIGSTIGLGVASLLTPVGPILAGASLIGCAVSGAWNIGRSIGRLVDRSNHVESISPTNGDALSAYFGIASSALAIGTNGGAMLMTKAIARGARIGDIAKVTFNSVVISNLAVSGCGIAFEGYRLIDQYQTQKKVNILDVMLFSSHILFFSNSLIKSKLASELIGASRGTVLEKFKNFLRSDRFEQEYARVLGNKSSSTGIIHNLKKITSGTEFLNTFSKIARNKSYQSIFFDGMVLLNGITLLDPFVVAQELLTSGVISLVNPESSPLNKQIVAGLTTSVKDLLREFYWDKPSTSKTQSYDVKQFSSMFNEMAFMDNAMSILRMMFKVATKVVQNNFDPASCLSDAIKFLWEYSKANLRGSATKACAPLKGNPFLYDLLTKIIENLFDFVDDIVCDLHLGFSSYMMHSIKAT